MAAFYRFNLAQPVMEEKELNQQAENWLKQKEEQIALNLRCVGLAKNFKAGVFKDLKPLWHTDKSSIDFSKQGHPLDEPYLIEGYSVLTNVDFDKLTRSFYGGQDTLSPTKRFSADMVLATINFVVSSNIGSIMNRSSHQQ